MPAGYQELFCDKGTTFITSVTLDDINGTPYDLSLASAKGQIRKSYYSANSTADFVVTIPQPLNGVITLGLSSDTTANITSGRYVYDVLLKDSSNNITKVLEGIINIIPQVTKDF